MFTLLLADESEGAHNFLGESGGRHEEIEGSLPIARLAIRQRHADQGPQAEGGFGFFQRRVLQADGPEKALGLFEPTVFGQCAGEMIADAGRIRRTPVGFREYIERLVEAWSWTSAPAPGATWRP